MHDTSSFSFDVIDKEYGRLGHQLGWRFLTCPAGNIHSATIALITTNPGGNCLEETRWSVEHGSAYEIESWKDKPAGEEKLQKQVRRMCELVGSRPAEILSGYLVPFRSTGWAQLPHKQESMLFGKAIWREILRIGKLKTVIAFGKDTAANVADLLDASLVTKFDADWQPQTIDTYRFHGENKLIALPHPSRFSLFYRPKSEQAFQQALLA